MASLVREMGELRMELDELRLEGQAATAGTTTTDRMLGQVGLVLVCCDRGCLWSSFNV